MMARGPDAERIGVAARRLLESGAVGDAVSGARLGAALPVVDADGALQSWFVPVIVGESLAGFLQLLPDATLMRHSSFVARPAAAHWLDPAVIRERAMGLARPGETAGDPVLSYDRHPDRLAWVVPLTARGEGVRRVYVAGEAVYEPPR